ncbi:fruit protein pKIWI501-like [Miscanthus floridulus]|uniref:fruit protein pKIWI501-like n=1 Tax=Miscanthus floridulus TaxID=154761 RepID=UPI00345B38BA
MPEARALGKRVVSLVGSTAKVEQVAVGAMQPLPQRVEGAPESGEDRPTPMDTGAVPPPPPSPLQRTRDVVRKRLCPHSSQKRQAGAPALAPRKALKVSTSSPAQWVVEVQAAIERGAASARADPKEPVAQGEATEAATKQAGEEAPMPHEAEARASDETEAPPVTEATEGEAEAPRTSEAKAMEAEAPRTIEAEVAEAGVGVELKARSLGKSLFLWRERGVWDQLRRQNDLLAGANELLSVRSAEVEDLHLRWLEKEVSRVAEASVEVQAVLEAKIQEHNAL